MKLKTAIIILVTSPIWIPVALFFLVYYALYYVVATDIEKRRKDNV